MKIFIELDKTGAEWVVVAYLSGDAQMLKVVESGESPHPMTGHLISGVPIPVIEKEDRLIGHRTDPEELEDIRGGIAELQGNNYFLPRTMSIRQAGKKSNHGLNYGMGYRRFALENEVEEREAKAIVSMYREEAYPGIPVWWHTIREQLSKDRTLINCFGRKRAFREAWGSDLFEQAYAFLPQSTVVDIVNDAMRLIYMDDAMRNVQLLAQVHDSLLLQVTYRKPEYVAAICQTIGLEYMNPTLQYNSKEFQIGTEAKIGLHWGEDGMKPIHLSNDRNKTAESIKEVWELINESPSERLD